LKSSQLGTGASSQVSDDPPMPLRPLAGARVLDVTTSIAGPYCAEILGALGADVIKIERPDTGDDGRAWGPPFWNGESAMFLAVNADKRSLAVSLSDPRGRDAVLRLVDDADVFVQSLRPGLAERLGLGASELRQRNPRLVHCSVGAYGRVGPLAAEPGYDALMQAAGGLISMTGEPGRPGVRVGSSLIDTGTGMWAALAVLAALLERERTGEGTVVDTSLYETALGYIGYHLVGYLADGTVPLGQGTVFPMVAPYQVFPTRDGELMVAGGNDRLFASLCRVLGLDELVTDGRFRTNPDRVRNRAELVEIVSARLRERDSAEWQELLTAAGVPVAPVADVADIVAAPQTEALGILQPLEHDRIAGLKLPALPVSFDGERVTFRAAPPAVGAHTEAILAEAGYGPEEIAALEADGVIRIAPGAPA
jgi:crotonobetainyl-CoA:carnitine CoA-transferase CaiB-like acyl-CoA transferase